MSHVWKKHVFALLAKLGYHRDAEVDDAIELIDEAVHCYESLMQAPSVQHGDVSSSAALKGLRAKLFKILMVRA